MDHFPNPTIIQAAPVGSQKIPLFLIHDGSGKIFNYFLLKSLGRAIYGIHNSCYRSAKAWASGIQEMAKAYLDLIRSVYPTGKILLGGWSLGGLISLEIALILARHEFSPLVVQGILMIDTVYPNPRTRIQSRPIEKYTESVDGESGPKARTSIESCIVHSQAMIKAWRPTVWPVRYTYEALSDSESKTSKMSRKTRRTSAVRYRQPPPPAILLRAKRRIPMVIEGDSAIYDADLHRDQKMLGWENYKEDFIFSVIDIDGHHLSIFDDEHISSLHMHMDESCQLLECDAWM